MKKIVKGNDVNLGIKFNIMPKRFSVNVDELKYTDIILDVRSLEEFNKGSITDYNIPILKESDRGFCYRYTPLVLWIIFNGLHRNKSNLCECVGNIINKKHYTKLQVILACSGGRLRSPLAWVYLRKKYPNVTFKVLRGGITKALEVKGGLKCLNMK